MKDSRMKGNPRVLLASGIFFPDVGGPATHVRRIAEHFTSLGWNVTVVAFGDSHEGAAYRVVRVSRETSRLLSWMRYGLAVVRESLRHDVLYGFDLTTAGLPVALAARITRKPFLLRIGGDPIWERIVEHGDRFLPMRPYYEQGLYLKDKPQLYRLIRFVIRSATVRITYCDFLRDIYTTYYGVSEDSMTIIRNPVMAPIDAPEEAGTRTFLFAGRFVSYKNLDRLLRVFAKLAKKHPEARLTLIGDGPELAHVAAAAASIGPQVTILPPLPQKELFERISRSSVAVAPALTEFNPNFILESLSHGKPAIISRDNGLSLKLPAEFEFDPLDDESLERAMARLLDDSAYQEALRSVQSLPRGETWETVLRAHETLVVQVS